MTEKIPTAEEFAKRLYTAEQIAQMTDRSWDAVMEELRARDAAIRAEAMKTCQAAMYEAAARAPKEDTRESALVSLGYVVMAINDLAKDQS